MLRHSPQYPDTDSDSLAGVPIAELASIDGEVGPTAQAVVPLPDDGLYRGDGVFEVIRLYAGRAFALADHLDRLERSAAAIELPVAREAVETELASLLERLGAEDGQLRIVLTRGGRRILLSEQLPSWNETLSVATVTYAPSVILTGVKSISYAANMEATRMAKARGAEEAIFVRPDAVVLEAPTSSLFWASGDGVLRTPSLECGILDSITRSRLIAELESAGERIEQGEYSLDELLGASEAFLASTTREVQAISRVDERELEAPGALTRGAQEAFTRVVERELAPQEAAR
jgi:branched-chain amino acid aminotransferase